MVHAVPMKAMWDSSDTMVYDIELNGEKGYERNTTAGSLTEAKEIAQNFLSKYKLGSARVYNNGTLCTTFYKDYFTGKMGSSHEHPWYIVGFNEAYPFTRKPNLTDARVRGCKILRNYNGFITVYKSIKGGFKTVGFILTNGSRFEWKDYETGKSYELNSSTGTIRAY